MKCPVCSFDSSPALIGRHFLESKDIVHFDFMNLVVKKYSEDLMSPMMIVSDLNIHLNVVKFILKQMNVKIRSHVEAVAVSMEQNRQNINAYGNGGFREDLQGYYRSNPEANFARILKLRKIDFEYEVHYELFDDDNELLCTYALDFLFRKLNQGVEIKGYQEQNGDFKNRQKIMLFQRQHPEIKLKVLFCNSQEWKELAEKYSKLIPAWEFS